MGKLAVGLRTNTYAREKAISRTSETFNAVARARGVIFLPN